MKLAIIVLWGYPRECIDYGLMKNNGLLDLKKMTNEQRGIK